jgi:hypothetical protein
VRLLDSVKKPPFGTSSVCWIALDTACGGAQRDAWQRTKRYEAA